jgi:MYXO-CTERM domain-containing protein
MTMKHQKALRLSILALGLACAFPAGSQQGSQGGSQSAAGGQSAASGDQRENNNWGWIGLLGLIGLAGLRRRDDRSYDGTRRAT